MKPLPPIGLGPLGVAPVHELVYQRLTHALMAGQIPAGRKLTSRKLAQEMGISDMPVRAALARLQALKALTALKNGSLVVPQMTKERFADLINTRIICEGAATELAASHLSKAELAALVKSGKGLAKAAQQQDIESYLEHNHAFKFQIYRACGSESLLFLIETLWLQVGPFLRSFQGKFGGDLKGILALDHHAAALEALGRADGATAAEAIRRDIRDGATFLLENAEFE